MYQLVNMVKTREAVLHMQRVLQILSGKQKIQLTTVESIGDIKWVLSRGTYNFVYVVAHHVKDEGIMLGSSFVPFGDVAAMLSMYHVPKTIFFNSCFGDQRRVWDSEMKKGVEEVVTSSAFLEMPVMFQYAEYIFQTRDKWTTAHAAKAAKKLFPEAAVVYVKAGGFVPNTRPER